MTTATNPLPSELAQRAVRRQFFDRDDAEAILDWCEDNACKFLGIDVADKQTDGNWMLLLEPMLDLSNQTDNFEAIRRGRQFLAEYDQRDRIFEPVWEGRSA
ncbi:MAG: hypothetical protein VYE13_10965 [Pseudomonadota bacterium]|nr:hypothetical protein [Pseudomonadota bacterium]